jgi:tetratricopeptide (TPR) repeat protein
MPMTRRDVVIAALIFAVCLVAFCQVLGHEFLDYDDDKYVTQNKMVRAGLTLRGAAWAFTTNQASDYWHPVTWLSHMLDSQLYGLNPRWHHLTSLLLHALNAALLYLVLRRATDAPGRSSFVALLFALHPLHVESVAWISERKDVLSTLFWIATLGAYVLYVERPSWKRYLLALVLFILGLLSKPMLVTLPFTLLLLDYWPLGRTSLWSPVARRAAPQGTLASLVIEKAPFFILSVLVSALNIAIHPADAIATLDRLPLSERTANAVVSYAAYIWKMIWPARLAVLYPHPGMPPATWIAGAAVLLALASVVFLRETHRRPYLGFGWLWYLGTLVPVIGLVQVGRQAMADRYTYMPLLGLFVIVAWAVPDLVARWRLGKALLPAAAAASVVACLAGTWVQLGYWKDSLTLFERTLAVTSGNWLIRYNLGCILSAKGQIDGAIQNYAEAIRLNPRFAMAHLNMGTALIGKGQTSEALSEFAEALRIDPASALAHINMGTLLVRTGDQEAALVHYREAARLAPDDAGVHKDTGMVHLARGSLDDAIASFQEALALDPDMTDVRLQIAIALNRRGRGREAIAQLSEVLRRHPENIDALNGLAWTLATTPDPALRKPAEAVQLAERASALIGGANPSVLDTVAAAYAEAGRFEDAIGTMERAIAILRSGGQEHDLPPLEERLQLYRSRVPYRQRPG